LEYIIITAVIGFDWYHRKKDADPKLVRIFPGAMSFNESS